MMSLMEGPEGEKLELGFAPFFGWDNGISCTGTWIHQQKNNRKWDYDCDNRICAVGRWDLVKI